METVQICLHFSCWWTSFAEFTQEPSLLDSNFWSTLRVTFECFDRLFLVCCAHFVAFLTESLQFLRHFAKLLAPDYQSNLVLLSTPNSHIVSLCLQEGRVYDATNSKLCPVSNSSPVHWCLRVLSTCRFVSQKRHLKAPFYRHSQQTSSTLSQAFAARPALTRESCLPTCFGSLVIRKCCCVHDQILPTTIGQVKKCVRLRLV